VWRTHSFVSLFLPLYLRLRHLYDIDHSHSFTGTVISLTCFKSTILFHITGIYFFAGGSYLHFLVLLRMHIYINPDPCSIFTFNVNMNHRVVFIDAQYDNGTFPSTSFWILLVTQQRQYSINKKEARSLKILWSYPIITKSLIILYWKEREAANYYNDDIHYHWTNGRTRFEIQSEGISQV